MKFIGRFICLLVLLGAFSPANATHIKAGEITVRKIRGLIYEFTLTLYLDKESADMNNGALLEPDALFTFSDNTSITVPRTSQTDIGNNTYKNVYIVERTLQSAGSEIKVSYQRSNRNDRILNINNGNSHSIPFYLETTFSTYSFLGRNNSPVLLYPPIDQGMEGQVYVHNPVAYDAEGDSISYKLSIPKMNSGQNVTGYRFPDDPALGGRDTSGGLPQLSLDPVKGDLIWNAPGKPGLYNVAFIVEEWRDGLQISRIVRDMQIEIKPFTNRKPELQIPKDTCIVAGSLLRDTIYVRDPDGNTIRLTAYSQVLPPAAFNVSNPLNSGEYGVFSWQTSLGDVREQPYLITFRAEDDVPPEKKLVDLKTWLVRVIAPAPENFQVQSAVNGYHLSWNPYVHKPAGAKMIIYRKDCDTSGFIPDACEAGVPGYLGYKKIGEVNINSNTYTDTAGINSGSFYCYLIAVEFPGSRYGKSYASTEECGGALEGRSLITNVSVVETDSVKGKINIRWFKPTDIAPGSNDHEYKLYRALNSPENAYQLIFNTSQLNDTLYTDTLLNTKANTYYYKLQFWKKDTLQSVQEKASSVSLSGVAGSGKALLSWTWDTPWDNLGKYHLVYRKDSAGSFVLIDSVLVTGKPGMYVDSNVSDKDTFCYYIETRGNYCQPDLSGLLKNFSGEVCIVPRDSLPPCPPTLFINPEKCPEQSNELSWVNSMDPECNKDIRGYKIYFAPYEGMEPEFYRSVQDTVYSYTSTESLSGCFEVTALNFYGIESARSNRVCQDICVNYELPNLVTPNGDGKNDVFMPFDTVKGVEYVKFYLYNRWGKLVFFKEDDIIINWNGGDISDGIYYYLAEVRFKRRLRKEDEIKEIKGWVHKISGNEERIIRP